MIPEGFTIGKSELYCVGRRIGDFQIGNSLIWAGENYENATDYNRHIPYACMQVCEFIHLSVRAAKDKNGSNGLTNEKYNGDKYKKLVMLEPAERYAAFLDLLQKGNRHDEMVAFTWFMYKHRNDRFYKNVFEKSYQDFHTAHKEAYRGSEMEGQRDWDRRQEELYAMATDDSNNSNLKGEIL